jgi:hypothetical protein
VCHDSAGDDQIKALYITTAPVDWPKEEEGGLPARGTQKPKFKANKQCTTVRVEYEKLRKNVFPPLLCVIVGWRSKSPGRHHDCRNCDVGLFGISHLGGMGGGGSRYGASKWLK